MISGIQINRKKITVETSPSVPYGKVAQCRITSQGNDDERIAKVSALFGNFIPANEKPKFFLSIC